jgi:hypothetical protein
LYHQLFFKHYAVAKDLLKRGSRNKIQPENEVIYTCAKC